MLDIELRFNVSLTQMKIAQFARLAGVTPSSIRFYERKGVLRQPRRTPSGYRDYDTAMLEPLAFIKRAEQVGFSLREIALLITSDGLTTERRKVFQQLVAQKLAQLPLQRRGLAATEEQLRAIDRRLKRGRVGERPERWLLTTEEMEMPEKRANRGTRTRRSAIAAASKEARRFRHHWLGAEHVLLGILADKTSEACRMLNESGLDLAQARAEVGRLLGTGAQSPKEIALTPRVQRIIGIAQGAALPSTETTTEHVLIGLLRAGESVGLGILRDNGVKTANIEQRLLSAIAARAQAEPSRDSIA